MWQLRHFENEVLEEIQFWPIFVDEFRQGGLLERQEGIGESERFHSGSVLLDFIQQSICVDFYANDRCSNASVKYKNGEFMTKFSNINMYV